MILKYRNLILSFLIMITVITISGCGGCGRVEIGEVGILYNKYGGDKGVQLEEKGPGKYWLSMNEELVVFPTTKQNYTWTSSVNEGKPIDESITFQSTEGMSINANVGITYSARRDKVVSIFSTYKKTLEEITDTYIRNYVRKAFVSYGSMNKVDYIYGIGKKAFMDSVQSWVTAQLAPIGFDVEQIYLVGEMKLPPQVVDALNSKITATQKAEQSENELRMAEADAKKTIAWAQGEKAKIELQTQALTPMYIQKMWIEKWNGVVSTTQLSGGAVPMVNLK